jgi:hypothetical protein
MSKKECFLIGLVLALGGLYVVYFSGWFATKSIRIEHTIRPAREGYGAPGRVDYRQQGLSVTFTLHGNYRLTELRVAPAGEFQTNKYAHCVWHLVSKQGSAPVRSFAYGFPLSGMVPAVAGAEPEALQAGVRYRLLVQTSKFKAEHDFDFAGQGIE